MSIKIACTECSKHFQLDHKFAGKIVQCPCGKKLRVPDIKPVPPQLGAGTATTPQNPVPGNGPSVPYNPFADDVVDPSQGNSLPAGQHSGQPSPEQHQVPFARPAAPPNQDLMMAEQGNIDRTRGITNCANCGVTKQPSASLIGRNIKCSCGAYVTVQNPNDPNPRTGPAFVPSATGTYQGARSRYRPSGGAKPRKPKKKSAVGYVTDDDNWNTNSSGGFEMDGTAIGGLLTMVVAVVWFVGGLMIGYLFYAPPVIFVIGLISLIRGLMNGR